MFDIGFWELCLIGVLALVVLGPERLPQLARTAGLWMGRARRFLAEVKADINREINEGELSAFREVSEDLKGAGEDFAKASAELDQSIDSTPAVESEKPELVDAIHQTADQSEGESRSANGQSKTASGAGDSRGG